MKKILILIALAMALTACAAKQPIMNKICPTQENWKPSYDACSEALVQAENRLEHISRLKNKCEQDFNYKLRKGM